VGQEPEGLLITLCRVPYRLRWEYLTGYPPAGWVYDFILRHPFRVPPPNRLDCGRAAEALSKIGSSEIVDGLVDRIDARDESGSHIYFKSLFGSLKKQRLYSDQLPAEVIERNAFWKENLKKIPVC